MWPCWQCNMMLSIILMSHDLSQPIRIGWETQKLINSKMLLLLKPHTLNKFGAVYPTFHLAPCLSTKNRQETPSYANTGVFPEHANHFVCKHCSCVYTLLTGFAGIRRDFTENIFILGDGSSILVIQGDHWQTICYSSGCWDSEDLWFVTHLH